LERSEGRKDEEEEDEEEEGEEEEGKRDLNEVDVDVGDDENSRSPRFKKFMISLIANQVIEFECRKSIRTKAILDSTRPETIQ
jgi:hypothetical protein